jgi:4-amino-4-deoxy-L-arabinose transferase-like glycosyltransferase
VGFSAKELAFLACVTAASAFLRLYKLDELPIGLCADTAYKGVAALRILHGEHPIFFAESWGGVEPMYMYITAGFMYLLGAAPLVIKMVSAIIGIATVPILYLLARDMFGSKTVGVLSSSWLAVSYWHLNYSRLGWEIVLVPLVVIITIYFLWRAMKSGRQMDFVWAGASLGASLYTYQAARALPVLVVVYLALLGVTNGQLVRRNWSKILLGLLIAVLVFAPLGIYFATHFDSLVRRANNVSIFNADLNGGSPLQALATSTAKTVAMFHLLPDPNWRHNPAQRPLLDAVTRVLLLLGLGVTMLRFKRPENLLLLVWIPSMALPALLTASGLPHSSRTIGLLPVACILPAVGLYEAFDFVKRRRGHTRLLYLTAPVAGILLSVVGASTYLDYFTVWDREELALAFDQPFVEAAEVMNTMSAPRGVWVLPLTSLADPGSVHDTIEFLYRGEAPHFFLSTDEATIEEELTSVTHGHDEAWVLEWNPAALGGAYLYHADPKGILPFLLGKYGVESDRKEFDAFDVVTYQLGNAVEFTIAPSYRPSTVTFGDHMALEGIAFGASDRDAGTAPQGVDTPLIFSGGDAWVALRWKVLSKPGADYKVGTYLVDDRGRVLSQTDKVMLSNRLKPTSQWDHGQVELAYSTLASPPATPPGRYHIEVAVYEAETGARLPVLDDTGQMVGESERLGSLQIVEAPMPAEVRPQSQVADGDLAPGIRLLGYDLASPEAQPGGTLQVALYWQALYDVSNDYVLSLELRDSAGRTQLRRTERPVDGGYPTTEWEKGEILRDWHDLPVPADMPQGEYELRLSVMEHEKIIGWTSLGFVSIRGRAHDFAIPEVKYPLQVTVGQTIRLLGYDLDRDQVRPGEEVTLTLYWQAVGRTETSYTVFTHLLDRENQIWAQQDSVPGSGTMPTTGWVEGEVITDPYHLTLDAGAPPGEYVLEIGMYNASTGERLPLFDVSGSPLGDRLLLETNVRVP